MSELVPLFDPLPGSGIKGIPPLATQNMDAWFTTQITDAKSQPFEQKSTGSLPLLPPLNPLDTGGPRENPYGNNGSLSGTTAGNIASGVVNTASLLTQPVRIVTVFIGLVFIVGGVYVLGTSQVSDAISNAVKKVAS